MTNYFDFISFYFIKLFIKHEKTEVHLYRTLSYIRTY